MHVPRLPSLKFASFLSLGRPFIVGHCRNYAVLLGVSPRASRPKGLSCGGQAPRAPGLSFLMRGVPPRAPRLKALTSDRRRGRKAGGIVLGIGVLCGLAGAAFGQDGAQEDALIEEVVVTANFREAALEAAPVSVSVLSAEAIDVRAAQHLEQVLGMAPNLNYAAGASRGRFLQARGVGERSQFKDPLDASVGLVIDGVDFSSIGLAAVLHDVRQVEVLRGPQGTAFGSNAMGGLVLVATNDPTEQFAGSLTAGVGNYGAWRAGAVLSGPWGNGVQGRLAVHRFKGDGYIKNDFLGADDTNGFDELAVRGKLRWRLGEATQVDLAGLYLDADNGYDAFSLENRRRTGSDEPGHDRQRSLGLSLNLSHDGLAPFLVEASLFREDSDLEYGFDWDWSNLAAGGVRGAENNARKRDAFGLDLRLLSRERAGAQAAFSWVAGAYYYRREVALDYGDHWQDSTGFWPSSFSSEFKSKRRAVYGQVDWALAEGWVLSLGGRFEAYDNSYGDSAGVAAKPDDDHWGGRISLQRRLSEGLTAYALVSRGFKTGGVNGQAAAAADPQADPQVAEFLNARIAFAPETLVNYEAGLKGRAFDGALQFSLSAFHMQRNDMQARAWVLFPPADWKSYLDNVDEGQNAGLEAEAAWRATERLRLSAGLGLLDTKLGELTVRDVDTYQLLRQRGREQAHAPSYQFHVSAHFDLNPNYFVNVQLEGKDAFHFSNSHDLRSSPYEALHLSFGYRGERLEVTAWGRNLTDADYEVRGFYFGNNPLKGWVNEPYRQYGEPRIFGVTVRRRFG